MKGLFHITRRKKLSAPAVIAALILILASWFFSSEQNMQIWNTGIPSGDFISDSRQVSVYYLDVGQGDSELIRLPNGENILIDAGLSGGAQKLTSYLRQLGVSRIDYLIATHPHADHIGGMTQVIQDFEIGKVYLPRVADDQVPTTRTYEKMLDAAAEKGLRLTQGKAGMTIVDEEDVRLEFLAPQKEDYDNLNNYSIVAKLTFGERSFLFTGDAEKESERETIEKYSDLHCDVLKVGHHGSNSSSTAVFLKEVAPEYGIISCGVGNDYGHPHSEVMKRLEKAGVKVYRTDLQGTIVFHTDGKRLSTQINLPSLAPDSSPKANSAKAS